jgi:hypothetical protein
VSGDHAGPAAALSARVRRLEELLEQRGLVDPTELDQRLAAFLRRASPANGARVAARAWLDDAFRERLLADANAALPELGLSMGGGLQEQRLKVVQNTEERHNVIVCTRSRGAGQRLGRQRGVPLHGPAPPPARHRGRRRAGPGRPRHPQRPDRRSPRLTQRELTMGQPSKPVAPSVCSRRMSAWPACRAVSSIMCT